MHALLDFYANKKEIYIARSQKEVDELIRQLTS